MISSLHSQLILMKKSFTHILSEIVFCLSNVYSAACRIVYIFCSLVYLFNIVLVLFDTYATYVVIYAHTHTHNGCFLLLYKFTMFLCTNITEFKYKLWLCDAIKLHFLDYGLKEIEENELLFILNSRITFSNCWENCVKC